MATWVSLIRGVEQASLRHDGGEQAPAGLRVQPQGPEGLVARLLTLLNAGDDQAAARAFAEAAPAPDERAEAERLSLLGFLKGRQGDLEAYHALALKAARLSVTPLTLYHLGLALPPRQGVLVLKEALAQLDQPGDQARLLYALSRALRRLGRLREALACASLSTLRDASPSYLLEWANLALMADDGLDLGDLAQEITPLLAHAARGVRLCAASTLAEVRLLEGDPRAARRLLEGYLPQLSASALPFFAPQAVRILRAAGEKGRARRLAQAALGGEALSPQHRGLGYLALGLAHAPSPQAAAWFEGSVALLRDELVPEAWLARVGLAAVRGEPLEAGEDGFLDELSPWGRAMFGLAGRAASDGRGAPASYRLRVLGDGRLDGPQGPVALRPRGLELVVLLLSKPEGWTPEALSEALYGRRNVRALKVELHRLRAALGGGVGAQPYRLTLPVMADFLELADRLRRGHLLQAVALYRGPLLPACHAPGVDELRRGLEEEVRAAVLAAGTAELLLVLAERLPEDLEVWEALRDALPPDDPRLPGVAGRVARLRQEYGL